MRDDDRIMLSNPDTIMPEHGVHGAARLALDTSGRVTEVIVQQGLPRAFEAAARAAFSNHQLNLDRLVGTGGAVTCVEVSFQPDAAARWRFAPC